MKANTPDANWLYCIPAGRVAGNQQGDSQEKTKYHGEGHPGEPWMGGRDTSGLKRASVKKAWRECIREKCPGN